jgi:hypothetical protein
MAPIPTVIHFEGLELESAEHLAEHLRQGTTTRPQDDHPFAWAVRFAAEGPAHHALLGEAIAAIVERAARDGQRPFGWVGEVIRLATNANVHTHGPALLRWLDGDTGAWRDAEVDGFLDQLFSVGDTPLPDGAAERIRDLARRPGCFDTGLAVVLKNWPWDAAALIGAGAAAAWIRGEPEVATGLTRIWQHELLPYRAELVHAVMACPRALQVAQREAMDARFSADRLAELGEVLAACASGEAQETATMTRRLVEVFGAFARTGNPAAAALVLHPRDLDQHPWAAQAARDQAVLAAYLARAHGGTKPATLGDAHVALTLGPAALLTVAIAPETSSPANDMLVYRIGHRFKIGLERPA